MVKHISIPIDIDNDEEILRLIHASIRTNFRFAETRLADRYNDKPHQTAYTSVVALISLTMLFV
jgi:hypothetical protein